MSLDQVAKVIGIIKNLFVILLVVVIIGSMILIRMRINEFSENLEKQFSTQEQCVGEIC